MNTEALNTAAAMLQMSADEIRKFPESVQKEMIAAVALPPEQAFGEVQRIWQLAYLHEEMQAVSRVSGVSMQTLTALPTSAMIDLAYLLAEHPNDAVTLNRRITDYLAVSALPAVAMLLKKPTGELEVLPIERQKELCGAYDMLYDTISADELRGEMAEMYDAICRGLAS